MTPSPYLVLLAGVQGVGKTGGKRGRLTDPKLISVYTQARLVLQHTSNCFT